MLNNKNINKSIDIKNSNNINSNNKIKEKLFKDLNKDQNTKHSFENKKEDNNILI